MTRHSNEGPQRPGSPDTPGVDARRRRLLAAGASSSLLLTIASRPAWAGGGVCTASALASANASGGHDFDGCSISAGWWKTKQDRWPIPHTTPFHSMFGMAKYEGNVLYENHTLGQVIDLNGGSDPVQGTFGFHLIGALMNALTFPPDQGVPGYAFTAQQVIDAYNALDGAHKNSFKSLAGTLEDANNQFDGTTEKPEPW